ncbi:aspartic peptidase domain-containing protein [Mycena belliarum]|uniref:Aspartic peptidase domain-containing protein n=1 Tax=Mycena belliarum TaxID=1033014 RepID=A0AAD6XX80_9AGAR|nr:aspartic peptidase domain-containing protein [Mycena belliae]
MHMPFSCAPPLFLLICALVVADARLAARALGAPPPPPKMVVIPLRLDENRVYSVAVNMSSNPAPQSFSFALSTSTGMTTVAGADCDSCGGVPSYNPSISTSVWQSSQPMSVATLNGVANGTLVREDCSLLLPNGSAWAYPNQTTTVASHAAAFFSPGISGVIGVGMAPFADTPAANWLARNPAQAAFAFGLALTAPARANASSDGGALHWLQPDADAYVGAVAWTPMRAAAAAAAGPGANVSSWFVEMDAWSVAGGPAAPFNVSQRGTQMLAFMDPYYASIVFPQSAARAIYADIPGASKHATSAFAHAWKLPCDSTFTLAVTFGAFTTSLDQSALVVAQADGVCVGAIQEWIDADATAYLLGSPFIAVSYLIFSYAQGGAGTMGLAARRPPRDTLSQGAIAGVVLGTVGVAALLAIAGVLAYSAWQRRTRVPKRRKASRTDITPFPAFVSASAASPRDRRVSFGWGPGDGGSSEQHARLLEAAPSNPASPDWRTTMVSTETNTFAGGTTTSGHRSRSSYGGYYQTELHWHPAPSGAPEPDSPPPYLAPGPFGGERPPLIPQRKGARPGL